MHSRKPCTHKNQSVRVMNPRHPHAWAVSRNLLPCNKNSQTHTGGGLRVLMKCAVVACASPLTRGGNHA